MASASIESSIGEYFHERLMPAEGVIPRLDGIDMYEINSCWNGRRRSIRVHQFSTALRYRGAYPARSNSRRSISNCRRTRHLCLAGSTSRWNG